MPTDDMKKAKAESRAEARRRMNPAPLWGRLLQSAQDFSPACVSPTGFSATIATADVP
jgi:hypothetical protein